MRKTPKPRKPMSARKKALKVLNTKRKEYIIARLAYFNQFYGFAWNRVTVKNMKTRFGSCSSLHNLNFSSRLFSHTPEEIDYVIVHELCHLKEMNHSKRFYELVAVALPDWKETRKILKKPPSA